MEIFNGCETLPQYHASFIIQLDREQGAPIL